MPLRQQEGLSSIIESKGIDGWDQLVQIFANCLSNLLIGIPCSDIVYTFEHLHDVFR